MAEFFVRNPSVLVVEDDPHVLSFMVSSLEISGFVVLSARSVEDALQRCEEKSLGRIWAVISDYWLPGENGLKLLEWIRDRDASLATVLITGQGQKQVVQKAMSLGTFEYLEKPVTHQELRSVVISAVKQTHRQRQSVKDREGLEALEKFDQHVSGVVPEELQNHIRMLYRPLHEIGGDFFITHSYSPREYVLIVGDVAGHDIKSGYVSTFFQGMFRGCMANQSRVQDFLSLSNRTLRQQSLSDQPEVDLVSLSLSAFYIDLDGEHISHWNYGLTPCYFVTRRGQVRQCPFGNPPLGWLEDIPLEATPIPAREATHFLAFTDGLHEFASSLEVSTMSVLYRLMRDQTVINSLPIEPTDDILVIEYSINPDTPLHSNYQPILSEHYAGTEVEHIDHLQANWRRSLSFALDDRLGDRLYDLLICLREGMLNAFIHGCQKAPDKFAHLQVSMNPEETALRVVIDDPGRGHDFDLKKRLEEIQGQTGKHLGLGIIQHLSDDFHIENKGTSLVFDFEINPVHA